MWAVEAAGPPGCLRVVSFAKSETDEGLDVVQPVGVEGEVVVIRHPARGEFPAVVEVQVREARPTTTSTTTTTSPWRNRTMEPGGSAATALPERR